MDANEDLRIKEGGALCSEGAQPLRPAGRLQAEIVDVCSCALRNSVRANTHEIYHLNKVDL